MPGCACVLSPEPAQYTSRDAVHSLRSTLLRPLSSRGRSKYTQPPANKNLPVEWVCWDPELPSDLKLQTILD
jgi:hypothetical protein